jgi:hypothetical protein
MTGVKQCQLIVDLTSLNEGDEVLWDDRKKPLIVQQTTFGSHVMVTGPNGAIYRVQPATDGGFRLGYRGGEISHFRLVEQEASEANQ